MEELEVDAEHELVFLVRVRSYGKRPVVLRSAEQALARSLHHAFGAGRVDIETVGERLADDGVRELLEQGWALWFGDRPLPEGLTIGSLREAVKAEPPREVVGLHAFFHAGDEA